MAEGGQGVSRANKVPPFPGRKPLNSEPELDGIEQKCKERMEARINEILPVLEAVAMGDFDQKIEIPEKEDEFTELVVALKLMIDDLEDMKRRLDHDVKQTEVAMREKLTELQKMNKLMIGREKKMIELKQKLKEYEGKK